MSNLESSRGIRLDQKVTELIPLVSRAFASRLIADGKVTVNGILQLKSGYKLRPNDDVAVDYDIHQIDMIPDLDIPVIYEDDDLVVIDKPIGLLVHSKGVFNAEPTVATWLRSRVKDMAGNRAGIVHRLDRATSGVMVCAKTPEALSWLQKQFAQRKVKKTYIAIVPGKLKYDAAIIDMPIERNPKAPATFRVGPQGKSSKTAYQVIRQQNSYNLLELKPETGRTHQLRVHLAHLGHSIVGDTLYGGEPAGRLYLHARELEITIPANHERKVFLSPTPSSFELKLEK